MDTTRKIPKEEIMILDELQIQLKKRGVEVTQKELIVEGIKMLNEDKEGLLLRLKRKDNTKEMTEKFLEIARKNRVDLGKNWLEEIDISL